VTQLKVLSGAGQGTETTYQVTFPSLAKMTTARRARGHQHLAQRQPGERRVQHGLQVHGGGAEDATTAYLLCSPHRRPSRFLPRAPAPLLPNASLEA